MKIRLHIRIREIQNSNPLHIQENSIFKLIRCLNIEGYIRPLRKIKIRIHSKSIVRKKMEIRNSIIQEKK